MVCDVVSLSGRETTLESIIELIKLMNVGVHLNLVSFSKKASNDVISGAEDIINVEI